MITNSYTTTSQEQELTTKGQIVTQTLALETKHITA